MEQNSLSEQSLVERLRIRAEIRRQIPSRKSVQEGKADRIADLLEEAADEMERLKAANLDCVDHFNQMAEERHDLVEALQEMVDRFEPNAWGSSDNRRDALEIARAALAKIGN